jgi:hypothetical protein
MAGGGEMGGGVLVSRGVAATDMPALQALAQVDPRVAEIEALLAPVSALVAGDGDAVEVGAFTHGASY